MSGNLKKKRRQAWVLTFMASITTGVTAMPPTTGGEIPKQMVVSTADAMLFMRIYQIFFNEQLSRNNLIELLTPLGFVAAFGGSWAYVFFKIFQGLFDEVANFAGPFGWLFSGIMSAFMTFTLGMMWTSFLYNICHKNWQNMERQGVPSF